MRSILIDQYRYHCKLQLQRTLLANVAGSKSSGNFLPFTVQIVRRSFVTSSYFLFTASHLGDSGITSLHNE